MINNGMMSSKTPEWATPQKLFDKLNAEFGPFSLDPCATPDNAKCANYYTKDDDGLSRIWVGTVFMNPPYGRGIGAWMKKAKETSETQGTTVVCLVPARTCSAWWHDYAMKGEIRFIRGRVKFGGHKWNAPFPSAIVIFRPAGSQGEPKK